MKRTKKQIKTERWLNSRGGRTIRDMRIDVVGRFYIKLFSPKGDYKFYLPEELQKVKEVCNEKD